MIDWLICSSWVPRLWPAFLLLFWFFLWMDLLPNYGANCRWNVPSLSVEHHGQKSEKWLKTHVSDQNVIFQEVQMRFMDGRIKLMNEILSGVKILKFYAWEEAFLRRVSVLRDGELHALKKSQILYSVSLASFNSSSFLVSLTLVDHLRPGPD